MMKLFPDKIGYDAEYSKGEKSFASYKEFLLNFQKNNITPFYKGGSTKGYVRLLTFKNLLKKCSEKALPFSEITILDAGCGVGDLSLYLADMGFNVIGIDISEEGIKIANKRSQSFNLSTRCRFISSSLENIPLENNSIDFIIGFASLHHFIKYEKVPNEFYRILKKNGCGFFADSFGENKLYKLFHNKEKMKRLGDVSLTKNMINSYFNKFKVSLTPTDWFSMFDKVYFKIFNKKYFSFYYPLAYLFYTIDRVIPNNRITLYLSGSVFTLICKYE